MPQPRPFGPQFESFSRGTVRRRRFHGLRALQSANVHGKERRSAHSDHLSLAITSPASVGHFFCTALSNLWSAVRWRKGQLVDLCTRHTGSVQMADRTEELRATAAQC
jgi:hypothetical protein